MLFRGIAARGRPSTRQLVERCQTWLALHCKQEVALLGRIEVACEDLLARCLENYYSLSETSPTGIADGGVSASEQPAPALMPAVKLCSA